MDTTFTLPLAVSSVALLLSFASYRLASNAARRTHSRDSELTRRRAITLCASQSRRMDRIEISLSQSANDFSGTLHEARIREMINENSRQRDSVNEVRKKLGQIGVPSFGESLQSRLEELLTSLEAAELGTEHIEEQSALLSSQKRT